VERSHLELIGKVLVNGETVHGGTVTNLSDFPCLSGIWTQLSTCTTVWDTETAHSWSNHPEDSGECGWSLGQVP
jgi:hypothetical protein